MDKLLIALLGILLGRLWDLVTQRKKRERLERLWLTELSVLHSQIATATAGADAASATVAVQVDRLLALSSPAPLEQLFDETLARRQIISLYAELRRYSAERANASDMPTTSILVSVPDEVPLRLSIHASLTPMRRLQEAEQLIVDFGAQLDAGRIPPKRQLHALAGVYLQTAAQCFGTSTGGYVQAFSRIEALLSRYQLEAGPNALRRLSSAVEGAQSSLARRA